MNNWLNDSRQYLIKDSRFKGSMNDSMDYSMHDLTTDSRVGSKAAATSKMKPFDS